MPEDNSTSTENMDMEGPPPRWGEPLAIASYVVAVVIALITLLAVYSIHRYEVLKSKRAAVVFLVLSGSSFALTMVYYGFLSYPVYGGSDEAWSIWQPPFYYIILPLRWLPITVLYLRLTICYYGYPRVYPNFDWVSGAYIQAARPGLKFMLATLGVMMSPYFIMYVYFMIVTAVDGMPLADDPINVIMWRIVTGFDFFYLSLSVLMAFLLFLERKSLRNYDLDQSKKLISFFALFIGYYIYAFCIDSGYVEVTFGAILAIHIWLLVMSLFVFYIWYLNIRALANRRKMVVTATAAGTEHGKTNYQDDDEDESTMYEAGGTQTRRFMASAPRTTSVVVELAVIPDDQPKQDKQN